LDTRADLPANTVIDGTYCIKRKIGGGGFGITYEAEDLGLGTTVALKEYYPADFGDRSATMSVVPKSERHQDVFEWGRSSFLDEAQMLARFRHPSIVRVTRVFQANDTAYMVMDYENGKDLEAWLKDLGRRPSQSELDAICAPLLDALALMHTQQFLHRDIAPDNIIIRTDGSPVLLDFGAARRAIAERTSTLTRIIKGGYSPHEQYAADGRLQGPWSDIYALGATLHRAIMGAPPEDATLRISEDKIVPVTGPYRRKFLSAVDACLKVAFKERPQSIAELRSLMFDSEGSATPRYTGRTRALLAVAFAGLLLAGGYGLYTYSQDGDRASVATTSAEVPIARTNTREAPQTGGERARPPELQKEPPADDGRSTSIEPPKVEVPTAPPSLPAPPPAVVQPSKPAETATASTAVFDGTWTFVRSITDKCGQNGSIFSVVIANNIVHGPGGKGSVSASGEVRFPGKANVFAGKLTADRGSGTYTGRCQGTFTARRKGAPG
jgi:serine/threonine protein kinase